MFAKSERVELAGTAGKFKGFPVTGVRGQLRGDWGAWRGQLGGQGGREAGLDFPPDLSSFPPPPEGEVEIRDQLVFPLVPADPEPNQRGRRPAGPVHKQPGGRGPASVAQSLHL